MDLIIEGKRAALKKGSSFDYVSENRAFTDADDYTLSITLPLAGCPQNLEIFGHVERMDFTSRRIVKEASIIDHAFSKNGVITVVEATEREVKCQFLEGRSAQNFDTTFDDVYINELSLGVYPASSLPEDMLPGDIDHGQSCVALPWVNDSAEGFMNNEVVVENGSYKWADSTKAIGKLSYMPYLIYMAERICEAVGYSYDFSEWEASPDKYLLVCNVLPASWDITQFARALPHWTVAEFFAELEKFMVCDFNIDHRVRHVGVRFSRNVSDSRGVVRLDKVVDAFSSELSYEDELCQYKGMANLRYADRGDALWKLQQCQWLIDLLKQNPANYKEFQTSEEFEIWVQATFGKQGMLTSKDTEKRRKGTELLLYVAESGQYYIWKVSPTTFNPVGEVYCYERVTVNSFGDVIKDKESDNDIELRCLPARIDYTDSDNGYCLFLNPSNYSETEDYDSDGVKQTMPYSLFLKGEPDSAAEYYDSIMLAYWDGHSANRYPGAPEMLLPPCPYVDERFSLKNRYRDYLGGLVVSPKEKLKISFLSSTIPDVRSVFYIRGKKYLCEKITATFTENGMSQLLKGEFYPIVD